MTSIDCSSLPVVFVTWFRHRRTTEISRHLHINLVELVTSRRGITRYLELTLRTASELLRSRPRVVIVQSPSLVLSLVALMLRPLLRYSLIVDAHNEAVEPYLHTGALIRTLTNRVLRSADKIIVTNPPLARKVEQRGGRPLVLPDRIPEAPPSARREESEVFHVVVVATFAGDEPIDVVLEAARRIGDAATFSVTGNAAKMPTHLKAMLPANVTLTGFLDEADYWLLLASCDLVMDLTTMDDCLVCGAYEALAVGTPLILSDNQASRSLFHGAALFTDNTPDSIAATLHQAIEQRQTMPAQVIVARTRIERLWQTAARELVRTLDGFSRRSPFTSD